MDKKPALVDGEPFSESFLKDLDGTVRGEPSAIENHYGRGTEKARIAGLLLETEPGLAPPSFAALDLAVTVASAWPRALRKNDIHVQSDGVVSVQSIHTTLRHRPELLGLIKVEGTRMSSTYKITKEMAKKLGLDPNQGSKEPRKWAWSAEEISTIEATCHAITAQIEQKVGTARRAAFAAEVMEKLHDVMEYAIPWIGAEAVAESFKAGGIEITATDINEEANR